MSIMYSAIIERDDYEAFRRILKADIPDTFDKWQYFRSKDTLEFTGRSEGGFGNTVRSTVVHPHEFIAYLTKSGTSRNLYGLDQCAREKILAQDDGRAPART